MKKLLIYVPGLGSGGTVARQRKIIKHWQDENTDSLFLEPNWQDKTENYPQKQARLVKDLQKVNFKDYEKVTIVGTSAGGSLGLNLFNEFKNQSNLKFICVCGKLKNINNVGWNYRSKNPAFIDSVLQSEKVQNKELGESDKQRVLSIIPLFDEVVNKKCMRFDGIQTKRQFTLGHIISIAYAIIFKKKAFLKF